MDKHDHHIELYAALIDVVDEKFCLRGMHASHHKVRFKVARHANTSTIVTIKLETGQPTRITKRISLIPTRRIEVPAEGKIDQQVQSILQAIDKII